MEIDTLPDTLRIAFWAALLFSGVAAIAELAVLDGLNACDDVSHPGFIIETVTSAMRRRQNSVDTVDGIALLPPELQCLFSLRSQFRDCFVLRILVDLDPQVCAGLLDISMPEFQDALYEALSDVSAPSGIELRL